MRGPAANGREAEHAGGDVVIWHDVECGAYEADLGLWEELAETEGDPVLDLGCGTGRVALHLARRGYEVQGVDRDRDLVDAFGERARAEGLDASAHHGDVCELEVSPGVFPLAIAPMQLMQLLGGDNARANALAGIARVLAPGGLAALAIVEGTEHAMGTLGPDTLPDVRERDGWLHSSLPLEVAAHNGHLEIRRLRQGVSPEGELSEREHTDRLDVLDAERLEAEAARAGLRSVGWREIEESELHVASTAVLLRREG